jgi:hypothetical protein
VALQFFALFQSGIDFSFKPLAVEISLLVINKLVNTTKRLQVNRSFMMALNANGPSHAPAMGKSSLTCILNPRNCCQFRVVAVELARRTSIALMT